MLEADGIISVYDIGTGTVVAEYEGLEVHDVMLAHQANGNFINPPLEDVVDAVRQTGKIYEDSYNLIRAFLSSYGTPPTVRCLGRMIDLLEGKTAGKTSNHTAWQRINGLERRGRLERQGDVKTRDGKTVQPRAFTLILGEAGLVTEWA